MKHAANETISLMTMGGTPPHPEARIALFQRKEVRRVIHKNEWWFVITDVVAVLTDSVNASDYLKKLRSRDSSLGEVFKGGGQLVPLLVTSDNYLALTQGEKRKRLKAKGGKE